MHSGCCSMLLMTNKMAAKAMIHGMYCINFLGLGDVGVPRRSRVVMTGSALRRSQSRCVEGR